MGRIPLLVTIAFLLLAPTKRAVAQPVTLTIRLIDHAPSFHVGEVIPLELVFSASGPESYEVEQRNYDRSGRLGIEQFHVTPAGRDPLKDFYTRRSIIGGGLGGPRVLNDAPWTIRDDLNEWIALDNPGHYSLYVTSGRVIRRVATKAEPVELRSNTLEFDVIEADAAWQQQTIGAVISVVDNTSSTTEERRAALRNLRFLNSVASVPELVRQLGKLPDGQRWDCVAGLWGSRERSLVVHTLEQQMSDPDTAVTGEYVWALAGLKFQSDHGALPPYPKNDLQQQRIWQDRAQSEQADLLALQEKLLARAATLVRSKIGSARDETIRTLLQFPSNQEDSGKSPAALTEEEAAVAFVASSPDQQYSMLSTYWRRLKSQAMVEPLKRLLQQPQIPQQLLRDEALRRLYELSPDEGTAQIFEEIRRPHVDGGMVTVKAATLGLLPNKTLPQLDELLARRLEKVESRTFDLDAQLVGRYSTDSILDRVSAVYAAAAGQWDCAAEDGFVLYFLRVEPDYGVKRLAAAPSFCMENSLPAVVRMKRWREIEPAIIKNLNDPDLYRARQAAETLAKYGGPKAEEAMWKRLRSFHEQWANREQDLANHANMPTEANQAMDFQFGLVEALGRAQAWVITGEQVTELENLTLGQERDNVKRWRWGSSIQLTIISLSGADFQADINSQYSSRDVASLIQKLAQFPTGTSFQLTSSGRPAQLDPVKQSIYDTAAEHGLRIQSQPQP